MKINLNTAGFISILLLFFNHSYAQQDTIPFQFLNQTIELNGVLDEEDWQSATAITQLTQREPEEGKSGTEKTKIVVLGSEKALYIGFWGYDSYPEKILAKDMKRDGRWGSSDNFSLILNPYNDNRNSYLFVITPSGQRGDALITDEGTGFNEDWNGVWDVAVNVTDSGWFAEIIIPYSTLKYPLKPNQIWAINFERNIRYKNEVVLWKGWSRNYSLWKISQGGKMTGPEKPKKSGRIELKPYISSGLQENADNNKKTFKIGGDIQYAFTPTTRLNITANTDFSQVESDRMPVNLSRFSVYMTEKRDFFLEGKDMFEFNVGDDIKTFYSRSIGIANGNEIPILGGVKLMGKERKSNFGFFSIQTDEEGDIPSSNFSLLRFKQDVGAQSSIGAIITSKVNMKERFMLYGLEGTYSTSRFLKDKNLVIAGNYAQSFVNNSDNNRNQSFTLYANYPNDKISSKIGIIRALENFNPVSGFMRRTNFTQFHADFNYNPRPKNLKHIRQLNFTPIALNYYQSNKTGKLESFSYSLIPLGIRFKNGNYANLEYTCEAEFITDSFFIHKDVMIMPGEYWYSSYGINLNSYPGRKITGNIAVYTGEFYNGNKSTLTFDAAWYANKHFNITGDYSRHWVILPQGSFQVDEAGAKVEYAFNPKCYNSILCQWSGISEDVMFNYRFHWIPKIGSDFYIAINQRVNTTENYWKWKETVIMAKLIWRFAI
jgi:hypothetical protein